MSNEHPFFDKTTEAAIAKTAFIEKAVNSITAVGLEHTPKTFPRKVTSVVPVTPAKDLGADFTSMLDLKLKQAELGAKGWKGRDGELSEVMTDLAKFAKSDYTAAHALWRKHVPGETDLPAAIESAQWPNDKTIKPATEDREDDGYIVPASIGKKYLEANAKFYFRDDKQTVAFEDSGHKLATAHDDLTVAQSMVELAQAKGWNKLQLDGTEEFKRAAWLEASLRGMETEGFKPRDVDNAQLQELRTSNDAKALRSEATQERSTAPQPPLIEERKLTTHQDTAIATLKTILEKRGDSEAQVKAATEVAADRFQNTKAYVGKLLEHGAASYEFTEGKPASYYAKIETSQGVQTVWGSGLKQAFANDSVKVGDNIALATQGTSNVTVKSNAAKLDGKEETLTTTRTKWAVDSVDNLRGDALAKVERVATRTVKQPAVKVFDRKAAPRPNPVKPIQRQPDRDMNRAR